MKVGTFIKQSAITTLATMLADGGTFTRIKNVVAAVDDTDKTGPEKKAIVLDALSDLAGKLAAWLLNTLIELAVAWLRTQAGTK
ncbi:hypothetical protein [Methylomonas koyamae]|uniref:hypothetical protein n=1 Tax=Methylomonas koyamae TaxID=702114 RepID=UPI0006D2884B|nr:hypothetical protein [Methylomonas koyamae]BBL57019.1 hypothetical protein MKFW12EY_06320 [Methylomonas koyamae]